MKTTIIILFILQVVVGFALSSNLERTVCEDGDKSVTQRFERACKWMQLWLVCTDQGVIRIKSANYGRTEWAVCGITFVSDCKASRSVEIVREMCEGQVTCIVEDFDNTFGDPCPYVDKYLDVDYECVICN